MKCDAMWEAKARQDKGRAGGMWPQNDLHVCSYICFPWNGEEGVKIPEKSTLSNATPPQ